MKNRALGGNMIKNTIKALMMFAGLFGLVYALSAPVKTIDLKTSKLLSSTTYPSAKESCCKPGWE